MYTLKKRGENNSYKGFYTFFFFIPLGNCAIMPSFVYTGNVLENAELVKHDFAMFVALFSPIYMCSVTVKLIKYLVSP